MPSNRRVPVVVGIDVGHHCTKVATSVPSGGTYPRPHIMKWKVEGSSSLQDTLRTMVTYEGSEPTIRYPPPRSPTAESFQFFKLEALSNPPSKKSAIMSMTKGTAKSAHDLLVVYLRGLLQRIREHFDTLRSDSAGSMLQWKSMEIDFVLSIPSVVGLDGANNLVNAAKEAGFENYNGKHVVPDIILTEPEAVGHYMAKDVHGTFEHGITTLVLDAGGGTTDLSIMKAGTDGTLKSNTIFLEPVSSRLYGGAYIDVAMEAIIRPFLQKLQIKGVDSTSIIMDILTSDAYFTGKRTLTTQRLEIDCLKEQAILVPEQNNSEIYIEMSELVLHGSLFARLTGHQVHGTNGNNGIVSMTKIMRDDAFVKGAHNPCEGARDDRSNNAGPAIKGALDFVFFAGGLGSSTYLQEEVKSHLTRKMKCDNIQLYALTEKTRFLVPDGNGESSGQLCVCLGLVYFYAKKIEAEQSGPASRKSQYTPWLKRFLRVNG